MRQTERISRLWRRSRRQGAPVCSAETSLGQEGSGESGDAGIRGYEIWKRVWTRRAISEYNASTPMFLVRAVKAESGAIVREGYKV